MITPILLTSLAATDSIGSPAFDWMLRAIGVAAIIWAFFNGLKSLVSKPTAAPPQAAAPVVAAPVVAAPVVAAPVVAAPVAPEPSVPQPAGITPDIIALIAAAVATVLGTTHRIVSIKSQNSHWEKAGRQSILTSHRIR